MILSLASVTTSSWISFASEILMSPQIRFIVTVALIYHFINLSMDNTSTSTSSNELTEEHLKWMYEYATISFNGHKPYHEFMDFFLRKGIKVGGLVAWDTAHSDNQENLLKLGCQTTTTLANNIIYTLPQKNYDKLHDEYKRARTMWHHTRQVYLRHYLIDALNNEYTQLLDISYREKVALIHEYGKKYKNDAGAWPMYVGLSGFILTQLAHPDQVVDWKMYACALIETFGEASECKNNLKIMRGVFGMQLVFRDDDVETVVTDIENNITKAREPCGFILVWRMNPEIDLRLLREFLKIVPKSFRRIANPEEYTLTEIPMNSKEQSSSLFNCLDQCLSFMRK
jgi:hypothetical protein